MPLIYILRWVFALLSIAILIGAIWLCWAWFHEEAYWTKDGQFHVTLVDWRLWAGAALFAWSLLGKFVWVPLLARPDNGEPSDSRPLPGEKVLSDTGATLHVTHSGTTGSEQVLVLTHGWGMDATEWSYFRREFGARYEIVTWDLAGLGQSTEPTAVSLEQMADDLLTIIDRLDRPAVLLGHSIGGMTIQTLARRRPDLFNGRAVAGVVLMNTTYTNPLATMILPRLALALRPVLELAFRLDVLLLPLAWLSSWQSYLSGSSHVANRITHGPRVTRSQLEHVTLLGTRNSPAVIARGNLAMFRWNGEGALAQTAVPVLILGASKTSSPNPLPANT